LKISPLPLRKILILRIISKIAIMKIGMREKGKIRKEGKVNAMKDVEESVMTLKSGLV